jgi:hypothetical protein
MLKVFLRFEDAPINIARGSDNSHPRAKKHSARASKLGA